MTKLSNFFCRAICSGVVVLFSFFFSVNSCWADAAVNNWPVLTEGSLSSEFWELVRGDLDDWQVVEGRLQASLQPPPSVHALTAIAPQMSVWPVTGNYQLSFDFTPLDLADKNLAVLFNKRPSNNATPILDFLDFHFIHGQLHVENVVNNFSKQRANIPYSLLANQTYRVNLIYQNPDFYLWLNDELIFSTVNDQGFWPDFTDPGRPLFYLGTGVYAQSAVNFSNFSLVYSPYLLVPYFSQMDVAWADEHYAHTGEFITSWHNIGDWGCALTTAAMLLQYYGYTEFPDQDLFLPSLRARTINPLTLNLWLQNEVDGYLRSSLVNWLAISRLSALLSASEAELDLPILEYQFAEYQSSMIENRLRQGQPVIAKVPGHFVLIKGLSDEGETLDYLINDPLREADLFSQHYSSIESLRFFQASFTDLSYWLLLSPQVLDFKVKNLITQEVFEPTIARESLPSQSDNSFYLYYWPKPASGEFLWQFASTDLEKFQNVQLFTYQSDGQVQIFNLIDYLASDLKLTFFKDQLASLEVYRNESAMLIYQRYILEDLENLQSKQSKLGNINNVLRYQTLIKRFLSFYQL